MHRILRDLRASAMAAVLLFLSACGAGGGGRPDTSQLEAKVLESINFSAEGHARIAEFRETHCEKTGEFGEAEEWAVRGEGEIELDGPCYCLGQARTPGERVKFEVTAHYLKDDAGVWHQQPLGIYEL
jgi:hypothetical protein